MAVPQASKSKMIRAFEGGGGGGGGCSTSTAHTGNETKWRMTKCTGGNRTCACDGQLTP